jgi:DNA repair protein RadC
MRITEWPAEHRPREKLLRVGADGLTDTEVLAVFLGSGMRGRSALDVAHGLIIDFGGIAGIFAADRHRLCEKPGVGLARYCQLRAAVEMARRALREEMGRRDALSAPGAVRDYLRMRLRDRPHEVFVVIYLDAQNRVIACDELFRGTLTQTSVYPREVVKEALRHNAASVIFAHNHPSGVAEPSHADESLTSALRQALALVDVKVLDHFIVAGAQATSFAERGLL